MKTKEDSMSIGEATSIDDDRIGSVDDPQDRPQPEPPDEPSPQDAGVLEALRRGDRTEALRLCARSHAATVGRLCMALTGSQTESDDLTQETFIAAHDGLDGYRAEGSVRAWLLGIARRKCARQLERRGKRDAKLHLVPRGEEPPDTEELVTRRRRAAFARDAMAEVRPSEREALLLRYLNDLSYRELADACGIEEAAARKRVSRAIAKLRTVLASKE
jgi:RNA polymerase sigma-70 factor (ECF subfamily)